MSRAHSGRRCCQGSRGRSEEGPAGCASTLPGQSQRARRSARPRARGDISALYSTDGRKDKNRRPSEVDGRRRGSPGALDVVVEGELVRMRPQAHGIHLVLPLVVDPGLDEIRREDVALEEEVVVLLEIV